MDAETIKYIVDNLVVIASIIACVFMIRKIIN